MERAMSALNNQDSHGLGVGKIELHGALAEQASITCNDHQFPPVIPPLTTPHPGTLCSDRLSVISKDELNHTTSREEPLKHCQTVKCLLKPGGDQRP